MWPGMARAESLSTCTKTKQKTKGLGRWHRVQGGALDQGIGMGAVLWVQLGMEGVISLYNMSLSALLAGPGCWGPAHRRRGPEDAAR